MQNIFHFQHILIKYSIKIYLAQVELTFPKFIYYHIVIILINFMFYSNYIHFILKLKSTPINCIATRKKFVIYWYISCDSAIGKYK